MTKKSFVSGAIILMIAGIIVRILGFVYRIYLSNLIGAEGMGLFQLISPVYSLVILTLTAGISIAVSKMVAEELARNHAVNLRRITSCALWIVMTAGITVSVFMYLYIDFIANVILKDSRTYYSLLLLIPCIPIVAAASALKGYFYGTQDIVPTAISQIVEQIVRIGLVMAMAGYFLKVGIEYACALATIGMAIGEMSNLLVILLIYRFKKSKSEKQKSRYGFMRKRIIIKELAKISVPISFNRFISSIMGAIEVILIPRRLLAGGLNYTASIAEYGKLTGMAMPLLFFPAVVTSSLATTLVPAISEAMSLKNLRSVNYRISKSVQISFIIGFIFAAIFIAYPNEISNIVYRKEKIGGILYMLSYTCVFMYLQQTLLGVMNGLGKQGVCLRNSIIGSTIRIAFVYFYIPIYGIQGYVWGIILSSAGVCALNLYTIVKTTGMTLDIRNWMIKPGMVGLVMAFTGKYIYSFFEIFNFGTTWTILLALICNILTALALMVVIGVLNKEELVSLVKRKK
jgi:stage V sporulation protein B